MKFRSTARLVILPQSKPSVPTAIVEWRRIISDVRGTLHETDSEQAKFIRLFSFCGRIQLDFRFSADRRIVFSSVGCRTMSSIGRLEEKHLSLAKLWEYRNKRLVLTFEELFHLVNCNDCVSVLGLCQISKSISQLERLWKEHNRK